MAAGTSSLKNGCLSLLQERKLSIGGGSKSGKLYFFNITFDGRLQCFEDKEVKLLSLKPVMQLTLYTAQNSKRRTQERRYKGSPTN